VIRTGLVIITAAALLGGCFYSDRALIGRFSADFPLEEGLYAHTPNHPDGRPFDRPMWTGYVEQRGGRYHSGVANFPHEGVRLREISPGLYAGMRQNDDVWLYGLVYVYEGGVAAYHQPQCDDLAEADRNRYEIFENEIEPGTCRLEDWAVLEAVLLSYVAGFDGELPVDGVYRRVEE